MKINLNGGANGNGDKSTVTNIISALTDSHKFKAVAVDGHTFYVSPGEQIVFYPGNDNVGYTMHAHKGFARLMTRGYMEQVHKLAQSKSYKDDGVDIVQYTAAQALTAMTQAGLVTPQDTPPASSTTQDTPKTKTKKAA